MTMTMAVLVRPFRTVWAAARRLPLRVQLVAALVVLLAAVLIGSYFVASATMRNYLLQQVDNRLTVQIDRALAFEGNLSGRQFIVRPPVQDVYLVQLRLDGRSYWVARPPVPGASTPALPADPKLGKPFTVPSAGDGANWRVMATKLPIATTDGRPAIILVATDQGEVDAAIDDLSRMYLWIAVGALVLLGGLGYALV
ncbi:MAG TPA: hypothetical protein VF892_03225, partial [Pseudonocardiaceae bacterium]